MNKFINLKTFEIVDNVFEVDDLIADTISILNKKGYYTIACCSGHDTSNHYQKQVCDIQLLDMKEIENDFPGGIVNNINDKTFDLISPNQITQIYILFKEDYHFNNIPKGFKLKSKFDLEKMEYLNELNQLEHIVNFYQNGKLRDHTKIEDEIKKYNNILLDWAKKLPNNLKGND